MATNQKKAQKMLVALLGELGATKKNRLRSVHELNSRLQTKIERTLQQVETEAKVRSETNQRLAQMQNELG